MPTFDIIHNEAISIVAAWTLTVGAVLALIGVCLPRLAPLEGLGKVAIVVVLGGYATGLWVLAWQGDTGRALTAAAYTGLLVLPFWTLIRLGRERRRRPAKHHRKAGT
ncbi:hypothetical protein [Microbacterium sp. 1P06AB]|uniref:hypothetical protein n=1 Tax=Microbacterium sp. 1P06AB TaxID=3132289 RepID=UPI0039A6A205